MKFHLRFLSAREFRGRNAPSLELDIASKYIALTAERMGTIRLSFLCGVKNGPSGR
jgi:hypothetical protein